MNIHLYYIISKAIEKSSSSSSSSSYYIIIIIIIIIGMYNAFNIPAYKPLYIWLYICNFNCWSAGRISPHLGGYFSTIQSIYYIYNIYIYIYEIVMYILQLFTNFLMTAMCVYGHIHFTIVDMRRIWLFL